VEFKQQRKEQMRYEVTVGNIGCVHCGYDEETARRIFKEYVSMSTSGYGRAAGESVVLWENTEPIEEHQGAYDVQEAREAFAGWDQ
jgi:hypothetical protein